MPELVYRTDFRKSGLNSPVKPMAIPLNYLPEKGVLISSVFLFSKVISLGPYLIVFSLQSGNCLFLMLASPKGGAQLWYQAVLWQHHKFKSHLYNHGNKSIDFSFRVVVFFFFQAFSTWSRLFPSWFDVRNWYTWKTQLWLSRLSTFSQSNSRKNQMIPLFLSLLCCFSSVTDNRHPRP